MSGVQDALKFADVFFDNLDGMQALTQFGSEGASAALATLSNVIGILQNARDGKIAPVDADAEIKTLLGGRAENRAAARARLDKKFDKSEG